MEEVLKEGYEIRRSQRHAIQVSQKGEGGLRVSTGVQYLPKCEWDIDIIL